MRFIFC